MLKVDISHISNASPQSRIYGHLYLLFLAFVLFYPISDAALDAFSDHLTHPPRMLPDEWMQSDPNKHSSTIVLVRQASAISAIIDEPVFHAFITRTMPETAIKTSQTCPLLSSGLAPPVI